MGHEPSINPKLLAVVCLICGMAAITGLTDSIPEYIEDEMLSSPWPQYDNYAIGRSLASSGLSFTVAVAFFSDTPKMYIPRYCWNNGTWFRCPWGYRLFDDNGVKVPLALTDRFHAYQPWFSGSGYEVWVEPFDAGDRWLEVPTDPTATAIALDGTTAAYGVSSVGSSSGIVLIFEHDPVNGWQQTGTLTGGSVVGSAFGTALDLDDGLLVVGAPHTATGQAGRAFVYAHDPDDLICSSPWCLLDELQGGQSGDAFGRAVAVDNSWIAVGAPNYDSPLPAIIDRGKAYIYERTGAVMTQRDSAEGAGPTCFFGASVALSGTNLLVGAPGEDAAVPPFNYENVGAAYLYRRSGNQLEGIGRLSSSEIQPGTESGAAVALTDFSALVGAPYLDLSSDIDRGTVLIYNGLVAQFFDGFESGDTSAWSVIVH